MQIFQKFGVMPSDQHLSINGIDLDLTKESLQLSDEEATLMNLQVRPNSSIQLVVSYFEICNNLHAKFHARHESTLKKFFGSKIMGD